MQEKPRDNGLSAYVGKAMIAVGLAVLTLVLALVLAGLP